MTGYLEWSIKLSLLMYVTSAPGGRLEADGVTSERGLFRFPLTSVDEPDTAMTFGGSVGFYAHHGSFITTLNELVLAREGEEWVISYRSPEAEEPVAAWRANGADAPLDGILSLGPIVLTEAGASAFGGYYGPGELFDPARIVLA